MKSKYFLFLLLWIAFFILSSCFWIYTNKIPPAWDEAQYLEGSEILYQNLNEFGITSFLNKTTTILGTKAPLITIMPLPLYLLFGSNHTVALIINIIFCVIFFIFYFRLVSEQFNSIISIKSLIIISSFPLFYGLIRYFYVEFGLMTIVTIWIYFALRVEKTINHKNIFLLGLITGFGMLMKFHFFVFILGPTMVILYNLRNKFRSEILNFKNALIFLISVLFITLPWYSKNLLTVLWKAKRSTDLQLLGSSYYGPPLSFKNIYYSGLDFINYVISGYWFIILFLLIALLIIKRKKIEFSILLFSWFIIPFLIFFLGPNKDYRLMLPLLPPFAIFLATLINKLTIRKVFLLICTFMVFPTMVYSNTALFSGKFIPNKLSLGPITFSDKKIGSYVQAPRSENWPIYEVLEFISKFNNYEQTKVVLASEDMAFNINSLRYYSTFFRFPLEIISASYFPLDTQFNAIEPVINKGNYLIMKTGGIRGPFSLNRFNDLILQNLNQDKWVELDHKIQLPDGGKIHIWNKIS